MWEPKLVTVDLAEVIWIDARRRIIPNSSPPKYKRYLSNYGLERALEKKLDPRRFIRVLRSAIINLAFVHEIPKTNFLQFSM